MDVPLPSETIFHTIEKTIKEYRKFAQKNLVNAVSDITIDQGMLLAFVDRYPNLTQKEIAVLAFRDEASMTRMIKLMTAKKYLHRVRDKSVGGRSKLALTAQGKEVLKTLGPIVLNNRKKALEGVTKEDLIQLDTLLKKITSNCIQL